jgi:hypothetical protein
LGNRQRKETDLQTMEIRTLGIYMNNKEISTLISKVAQSIEDNEKLPLPILAAKARREASARSTDVPLVQISQVLTKMASDRTFISRDELLISLVQLTLNFLRFFPRKLARFPRENLRHSLETLMKALTFLMIINASLIRSFLMH